MLWLSPCAMRAGQEKMLGGFARGWRIDGVPIGYTDFSPRDYRDGKYGFLFSHDGGIFCFSR